MIKKIPAAFLSILIFISCAACFPQEIPSNMKLFLLIGQSNMAGRGIVEEQDKATNPRIFMLDKEGKWVLAKDPVHFDKSSAGIGLCSQFARDVLKAEPESTVGLIPCAVGGTSLKQWNSSSELFKNAVDRARIAMKNGALAGILWHQGEADSSPKLASAYPRRFAAMISSLRKELGAENVPVLVGELGTYNPSYVAFNGFLAQIPPLVPNCAIVSSAELSASSDKVHFNSESLRIFGSRYAEAYLKLKASAAAK